MENSSSTDLNSHLDFKYLAEKSIGSSISAPVIITKHKRPEAEEKFKANIDKKVTALYMQLLQNRVNKLKRTEQDEKKRQQEVEKIKLSKTQVHEHKVFVEEERKKMLDEKKFCVDKIKEKIIKSKIEHNKAMKDIKKQVSEVHLSLNKKRNHDKKENLRIKSLFIESSREKNYTKAQAIRDANKRLETSRVENWKHIKEGLHKEYLKKISEEKAEKMEFEKRMKALETEEAALMQRLGKSMAGSVKSI